MRVRRVPSLLAALLLLGLSCGPSFAAPGARAAEEGWVVGWGENSDGQSSVPEGLRAVETAAGTRHSCALDAKGRVRCWGCADGRNDWGQCDPTLVPEGWTMQFGGRRTTTLPLLAISAGEGSTCGINEAGGVECWGCKPPRMLYQCAVPKGFKAKVPTAPGLGRGLLAAGDFHTCAVAEDGSVACWGCEKGNDRGQCRVPDDLRATAVYVSRHHTCAIRTDGSVVCWGDDAHGQSDAPSDLRAESLTLGEVTTCALESGGGTRCWGRWRRDGVSGGILDRIAESLAPKRRTKPPIPERAGGIALDGTGRVCSTDPHGRLSCGGCPKADDPFCARPFLHPLQASGVSARDGHGLALVPSVPDGWPAAEAAKNLSRGEAAAGRPALPPTKAWLSEAGDFRHASGMRFKTIPTGKFWMGACSLDAARMQENRDRGKAGLDLLKPSCPLGVPEDPDGNDDEGPVHEVYIGTPLQVSVFETTVGDWRKFLAGTGRTPDPEWEENNRRPDHYPAVWISWHDAKSFAEWLNRSKAADDPGFYRLPSETEWEYAARGGARGRYTWGESPGAGLANCMECGAEGTGGTLPAGTFPPNAFGLYEVLGNVDEWVEDCFVPTYEGAPTDGSPRRDGTCAERPARGGSWEYPGASVRLGWRDNYTPDARTDEQGVRIVREIRP